MKKAIVLIITSARTDKTIDWKQREQYVRDFYESVESRLEDTSVLYTTYDDIMCVVQNNKVTITDTKHDIDLKNVHLIHFKNWMFDYEHASLIAHYLRKNSVSFVNEEVDAGLAWGKISQICRLAMDDVPVCDTLFLKHQHLQTTLDADALPEGFNFPLILKADYGSKGSDNYLVHNAEDAASKVRDSEANKQFVVQTYHPNDGDYRYLFIGTDAEPIIFHRKAEGETHLNNTSKGGAGTALDVKAVPPEHLIIARKAAACLKREISGVDILVDKNTNEPYVLEVNSTPALATGYDVSKKVIHFTDFIKRNLELAEEE